MGPSGKGFIFNRPLAVWHARLRKEAFAVDEATVRDEPRAEKAVLGRHVDEEHSLLDGRMTEPSVLQLPPEPNP